MPNITLQYVEYNYNNVEYIILCCTPFKMLTFCPLINKYILFSLIVHQGGDISSFPENNNPGEGFQTGSSEERAGEGHQEDGKVII